jgi:putative transposase
LTLDNQALKEAVLETMVGVRVSGVLDRLAALWPMPHMIVVDNGLEFTSRAFDAWACEHGIQLRFIGRPNPERIRRDGGANAVTG